MNTWDELRELAAKLDQDCQSSPCMSIAHPIVANAVCHLRAIARTHEMTAQQSNARVTHTVLDQVGQNR